VGFLIDTNIIIYKFKNNPAVIKNFYRHKNSLKYLSAITLGEMVYGAYKSQKVAENYEKVNQLRALFPVIPVTDPVFETFGRLKAVYGAKGITIEDFDLLLAATALAYGLVLVTHNLKHFQKIKELTVEDWTR